MPDHTPSDNEVIANQLAVSTATLTTTAKSLAAQFGFGDSNSDDDDGPQAEQDVKVRDADTHGIGYLAPHSANDTDSLATRADSAAPARLRHQLLGKHAKAPRGGGPAKFVASTPRPAAARKRGGEDSDEEEGGRAAVMGKGSKRQRVGGREAGVTAMQTAQAEAVVQEMAGEDGVLSEVTSAAPTVPVAAPSKKRGGTSYLDQLLAERAAKKSKKRKKNKNGTEGAKLTS